MVVGKRGFGGVANATVVERGNQKEGMVVPNMFTFNQSGLLDLYDWFYSLLEMREYLYHFVAYELAPG